MKIERVSVLCGTCILNRNIDNKHNKKSLANCPYEKCIYSKNELDKIRIELETNRFNIKWREK